MPVFGRSCSVDRYRADMRLSFQQKHHKKVQDQSSTMTKETLVVLVIFHRSAMSISLFTPGTPHPCLPLTSTSTASKPLQLPCPSPTFETHTLRCPPLFLRRPIAARDVAALCIRKASQGMKEQKWTHEGVIVESLPNGMFRVRLDNEDIILGYISGKIRKNFIRMLPGDKVKIEVSRYDSTRGRIIYRLRNKDSGD